MSKDEALKLALSTLDEVRSETFRLLRNGQKLYAEEKVWNTINAIKEALAQPEQEPAATMRQILEIIAVGDSESPMQDACDTLIATGFWATDAKPFVSQPKQEPVAFGMLRADGLILDVICPDEHESFAGEYTIPLYTTPPQRPWVGLTDAEAQLIYDMGRTPSGMMEMAESKLKEKNTWPTK